jgi:phosphoglycerate dehydrogenase-like enzyme
VTIRLLVTDKIFDEGIKLEENWFKVKRARPRAKKLLTHNNMTATPHISAQTCESQLLTSLQIVQRVIETTEKNMS